MQASHPFQTGHSNTATHSIMETIMRITTWFNRFRFTDAHPAGIWTTQPIVPGRDSDPMSALAFSTQFDLPRIL